MKTAYSYQRFSSIKQKEGDSTRRQNDATERFCRAHGLMLAETFRDEEISAFKGKNFAPETAPGDFMRLIDSGSVNKCSVLLVENLDRLSRSSMMPCLMKFQEIISQGVSIGVISQNRIYDFKSLTAAEHSDRSNFW